MDIRNVLERGFAIWATAFAIVAMFFALGVEGDVWVNVLRALVVAVVAYAFARQKGFKEADDALAYGLAWAVAFFLLDFFVTTRYFGMSFFQDLAVWVGYLLVLIGPILALKGRIKSRK